MRRRELLIAAALCGFVVVTAAVTPAAEPPKSATVITIAGEMCGGCVKRIEGKLQPMAGVAGVRCDIQTKSVTVVPKAGATLSPRTLWTAMELIGKTPAKLAGPAGTFTERPKT